MTARLVVLRLLYQLELFFPLFVIALFVLMLVVFRIYCGVILNPRFRNWDNARKAKYLRDVLDCSETILEGQLFYIPSGVTMENTDTSSPRVWKASTLTNYTWKEIKRGYKEPVKVPKFLVLVSKLVGGIE